MINIENAFLNHMHKNKKLLTIFLANGIRMYGTITCFNKDAIIFHTQDRDQLIYKSVISTIVSHEPDNVFDCSKFNGQPSGWLKKIKKWIKWD